jgi:hypothetical protein
VPGDAIQTANAIPRTVSPPRTERFVCQPGAKPPWSDTPSPATPVGPKQRRERAFNVAARDLC